jgi:UDP-N-acetylglucosamine--N-acetylmuramyl-(pentapeptide) pyrophosphoryl-undecaprenol N-acetylglucosamine transferase
MAVIGGNVSMARSFIIAGGGTGGHLYPALAIGSELQKRSDANVHYVGSTFGIEADKLPNLNVDHTLLPIRGLQRSFSLQSLGRNALLPSRILASKMKTNKLFDDLEPSAVIGTGGYASALPLHTAVKKGIPVFLQEQNSYPGITTRHFAESAEIVFTAFPEIDGLIKKKTVSWPATRSGRTLLMGNA